MTTTPTLTKRIGEYDRYSKDYPAYAVFEDGHEEYIGSRPTQHDASLLASDYIIQFYQDSHTPEKAAQLIHDELIEEGRHEQLAADMGGVWGVTTTPPEGIITTDSATCSLSIMLALDPPPGSPTVKDILDRIFLSHPELDPTDIGPDDGTGLGDRDSEGDEARLGATTEEEERYGALFALAHGIDACTICGGAHRPTQCPRMANAPIYLCPSCDDLTLSPSLCQACIETGEAVNWDIDDVEDEELDEEIPEDEATLASPA